MEINGKTYAWANWNVKRYMMQVMTEKLNNCKLFTDVFGEEFAKKNLHKNIKHVLTNIKLENALRML